MKERRVLSTAEKAELVRRVARGERLAAVASESCVLRKSLYEWRAAYESFGVSGLNRKRGPKPGGPPDDLAKAHGRIAELERLVGRQQADLDFFRKALRSWDEKRRVSDAPICSPSSKK